MTNFLSFVDRPMLFIGSAIVAIPLYFGIAQIFFDGWDDFLESLRYIYQPAWLSALRGEFYDDQWASVKFLVYLVVCVATATMVYKIAKLFL